MSNQITLDDIALGDITASDARPIIFEALNSVDRSSAQRIYAALRDWLWKALNRRRRDPELKEWYDLMRRAASRLSRDFSSMSERIVSLYELLYESVATFETLSVTTVVKRKHVQHVLDLLAVAEGGTLDRLQLQTLSQLNQANLSRILNMMETVGLIDRSMAGKQVVVSLTRTGRGFAKTASLAHPAVKYPRADYTELLQHITAEFQHMNEGLIRRAIFTVDHGPSHAVGWLPMEHHVNMPIQPMKHQEHNGFGALNLEKRTTPALGDVFYFKQEKAYTNG
jgi:predicted transcriptional regulator